MKMMLRNCENKHKMQKNKFRKSKFVHKMEP